MIRIAAVSLALSAITSTAAASTDAARLIVRPPSITLDSVRVAESLRRASALVSVGKLSEARRVYRSIITAERAEGGYPATPLWFLANAYYADNNLGDAASTLDKLANAAQEVVDPATELRARIEATFLWAQLKRYDLARSGLARVRVLIKSPAVSDTLRTWAKSRIGE